MFDQPAFQRAKFKRVRYFIAWNAMDNTAARLARRGPTSSAPARDGFSVLLHVSSDNLVIKKAKLPSVAQYRSKVGRLVHLLPRPRRARVRHLERGQPRQPADLPQPDAGRAVLPRDVPHGQGPLLARARSWRSTSSTRPASSATCGRFYRALSSTYRRRATLVGIHNYGDVNRVRTTFTSSIIRQAHSYNRSTNFWFTETGGIVKFGRSFPCSTSRARQPAENMFKLARTYRSSGVERVVRLQLDRRGLRRALRRGPDHPRAAATRPAYNVLRQQLPNFLR